eukprot:COSAG01_NODE_13175_length_1625_cov_1.181520_1_plen_56_part_10
MSVTRRKNERAVQQIVTGRIERRLRHALPKEWPLLIVSGLCGASLLRPTNLKSGRR